MKVHNNKTAWKRCEVYPRMGAPPLLSLVFLCVFCASVVSPASAQTTITGTVKDASGTALTGGTIIFTLSQEGTVSDPALLVVQPVVTCTITNGVIGACSLRGNDEISPAGTFYRVRIISSGGRTFLPERSYTITGATWDIGTATPLASDTVTATAYQIVQDEGTNLTQRQKLNFTGAGVNCVDNSTDARTDCAITGGGGGGSTHQIDGVALTAQDPINFLDTSEFDWTNPAAGNLSLALKAASVADSKLAQITTASKVSGAALTLLGSVPAGAGDMPLANLTDGTGFLKGAGGAGTPAYTAIADGDLPASIARDSELHAPVHVLAGSDHTASGLTTGNVIRATGATTFAWQQLGFSDLGGAAGKAQIPAAVAYEDEANIFTAAGGLTMDNNLGLRIRELTSNGTSYFELLGPASLTANVAYRWNITGDCTGNVNSGALTINASKEIICSDDDGGAGGSGDSIEIEQGDDTGTFDPIDTSARFDDSGDINFIFTDGGAGGPDIVTATVRANSVALATDTTGNYVGTVSAGTGIAVTGADAENATKTVAFDFSDAGADPVLGAEECRFSNEGASTGGWVCEGLTADTIETRFRVTDPASADRVITFPDAGGEVTLLGQTIEDGELASNYSGVGSCTNQFARAVNDNAAPTCASVGTADITNNAITDALLRDSAATSVIGRSAGTTGDPADIAASADGQVLRRAAGALGFGALDLADTDAVTGVLPDANVATSLSRDSESVASGDVSGSLSAGYTINAGAVASPELATANKTFVQPVVLFDSTGLLDADDIPSVFRAPAAITVTEVWCETDAGTPSINFQRDDGTPANLLSSNLTPTTSGATGTIAAAEDNFAADERLDFVMVSASTAKRISCMVKYTVD